ncbi:MAG TPA: O-antigen ligase family protein [Steroidobacteraceae bacterium]
MSEHGPGLATPVARPPVARTTSIGGIDAVTILTFYLLLLLFIPYYIQFSPLGGSGGPATMFAATLLILYVVLWLRPAFGLDRSSQPVRVVAVLFVCVIFASYISANRHALPGLEQNGADRGLISVFGWVGVLLLAADGIDRFDRLKTMIRRIVLGVTVMAGIGITQFFTGLDITKYITIPGFANVLTYSSVAGRNGLIRPASTAAHPLEFAAVLAMALPLALHQARFAPPDQVKRRWLQVLLIATALPMTVSRSAILGLIVVAIVLLPTWPKFDRRVAYVAAVIFIAGASVSIHGLLRTFMDLFSNSGAAQASTQSRTNAFSSADHFIAQHPWFGSGFGTFPPQVYFFTDDQYLNSIIVTGVVGLLALLALFVTGWVVARSTRRLTTDADTRDLAQCLAASIAVAALTFATYDALSFTISAGLTFLLLGCIGALWRLVRTNSLE